MATLEDLAINVLMDAPDCPTVVAERAILRAARDLCKRARCWRITVPSTYGADGVVDFADALSATVYGDTEYSPELVGVISIANADESLSWDRNPLRAKTPAQMDKIDPEWRLSTATSAKYYVPYTGEVGVGIDNAASKYKLSPIPTAAKYTPLVSSITQADPGVITVATTHGLSIGDRFRLRGFSGMTDGWATLEGLEDVAASTPGFAITGTALDTSTATFTDTFANSVGSETPYVEQILLDARVAVTPGRTASAVPDTLLVHFEEIIISGALSYVLRMPEATWTNPEIAGIHKQEYESGVQYAADISDDENMVRVKRNTQR